MHDNRKQFRTPFARALLCLSLALTPVAALADVAIARATPLGVHWQVNAPNGGVSLRVIMPDGSAVEQQFPSGTSPWFVSEKGGALPDGQYAYELVVSPDFSPQERALAQSSRASGQTANLPKGAIESGVFLVKDGVIILPDPNVVEPRSPKAKSTATTTTGGKGVTLKDQVIPDDLIVQGSACIGLDCVNNESFGFDTIRLKENNTRIKFDDTSTGAGFPANDWQLTANDSASGGANKFSIEDITGAKVPFTIRAGAADNSLFVDSNSRVGLRTSTPVLDLHINTSNTPAVRLEQNSSGGFTAQTWDIAGNEANFFIRDVTGGSRLPFRIRPGAPTSSIDINASGNVGIGTASPAQKLHVETSGNSLTEILVRNTNAGANAQTSVHIESDAGNYIGLFKYSSTHTAYKTAAAADGLIYNSAGGNISILNDNAAGNINFAAGGAATAQAVITSAGNVGIGTPAPTAKLSVNGTADKPGGGSWGVFSDERLKNVKGRFSSGLDAIMQLQPIRYEYKADNPLHLRSGAEYVGFGARALQEIIPEAVTRNDNGYLVVNNDPILWTMLNAIKEQAKEIANLKGQVKRLEATGRKRAR